MVEDVIASRRHDSTEKLSRGVGWVCELNHVSLAEPTWPEEDPVPLAKSRDHVLVRHFDESKLTREAQQSESDHERDDPFPHASFYPEGKKPRPEWTRPWCMGRSGSETTHTVSGECDVLSLQLCVHLVQL